MPPLAPVAAALALAPFVFAGGVAVAAGPSAPGTPAAPPYEESLTVREAELVVQAPDGLSESRRRALPPGSLMVFENGAFREVASLLPLESREGEWTLLVAFDRALVSRDTLFRSALALGRRAERLARLGSVELVELGATSRRLLAPTREPVAIAQAFADLGASSPPPGPLVASTARPPVELGAVRHAGQRLLGEAASRTESGARALLWLTDLAAPPAASTAAGARDLAALTAAAQAVAAYGWTVVAVGLTATPEEQREHRASEFDRLRQLGATSSGSQSFPLEIGRRSDLDRPGALNVFLQPTSALVRALARESGGVLVGVESQLDAALDDLGRRLLAVYRAPAGVDGELRAIEVRLLPDDLPLRAVRWQRSGTPEAVAVLRLGGLTTGGERGTLPLRATAVDAPGGRVLRVEAEAGAAAEEGAPAGPVRLTWAGGDGVARHRVVTHPLAAGWVEELPLAGGAESPWSVVVEDLGRGAWGGVSSLAPAR